MNGWVAFFVGAVSSVVAAMGLGGGGVLLVCLSFLNFEVAKARGINLMLFVPSAIIALVIHWKNGLIKPQVLILPAVGGLMGAAAGVALSSFVSPGIMSNLFGLFLAALGFGELIAAFKNQQK